MWWSFGFVLGGAIVLVVAILLIAILSVARNIRRLAGEALSVAGEIENATKPIWNISAANGIVSEVAITAKSIESRLTAIAAALERDVRVSGEICEASCCQVFQGTPGSRKAEVTGVNGTDSNRAL